MKIEKDVSKIWDLEKETFFNEFETGEFPLGNTQIGVELDGNQIWEKIKDDDNLIGFVWMTEGNEVSIAISRQYQRKGHGSEAIKHSENNLKKKGFKSIEAIVRTTNPKRIEVIKFLQKNGFTNTAGGNPLYIIVHQDVIFTKSLIY